jgi:hypothetical protein
MIKTLNIYDAESKGKIRIINPRKNSKVLNIEVKLDNYGFNITILKESMEEILK